MQTLTTNNADCTLTTSHCNVWLQLTLCRWAPVIHQWTPAAQQGTARSPRQPGWSHPTAPSHHTSGPSPACPAITILTIFITCLQNPATFHRFSPVRPTLTSATPSPSSSSSNHHSLGFIICWHTIDCVGVFAHLSCKQLKALYKFPIIIITDRFYFALFSAHKKTHCAHVACNSE